MKLRWGTAIVLSFILFIGFMGYMATQIIINPDLQHSLVTSNYYQKEQTLNALIQAKKNALSWKQKLRHQVEKTHIRLGPLPKNQRIRVIGYCPSDASRDFSLDVITQSENGFEVMIPKHYFGAQYWELHLRWQQNDSLFFVNYPIRL
jgi:hypothetical protein